MKKNEENNITETPFGYTSSLISGKWKTIILYLLLGYEAIRYNELQRKIGSITHKMLSSQLKELEADKLITRKEYPMIPPKVEYSLAQRGRSLIPTLDTMCYWDSEERLELDLCVK